MKHKRFLGYGAIGLTLIAIGVAFIRPIGSSNMLFRVLASAQVTGGTITFNGTKASKSGTTNTTVCNSRVGGNIICKTFNNDSTQSSGRIGAMKTGSIMRFYESDGATEFTFQDLDVIRIEKIYESNSAFDFTLHALYTNGTEFTSSYKTLATTDYKQINFKTFNDVSNIWLECTSESGQLARITNVIITYNCSNKSQTGVNVVNAPAKTSYEEGESFDPTGMIIAAVYSDSSTVATNSYTYYPTGSLTPSDTYVTVYFGGFSTTQSITVSALPELTGLYVSSAPTKTTYYVNDSFDPSGMTVMGTYEDGNDREVTGYTYTPSGALTLENTSITISYGGFSTTQSITVKEKTYAGTYSYTSGSNTYTLIINQDGSGYYHFVNGNYDATMHFTWVVTGDSTKTITFTKNQIAGDAHIDTGSYYNLFTSNGDYNTTNSATITDTNIKLYTCSNQYQTGAYKTLTKQVS